MVTKNGSFEGRLVVVTGGSSGMGLALARLLAAEGARVWLLARHHEKLEAALESLPGSDRQMHGFVTADVTNWDRVHAAVRKIRVAAGVPDVLINCAGAAHAGYLQNTSLSLYRDMMELNYFGTVHMVQAVLPGMLARGSGYIVNFSSGAGFLALFGYAAYIPSKYAVRGFSDSLRLEMKPLGIRVSVVFPPDTDTPGLEAENKTKPFETLEGFSSKVLPPETVAHAVLRSMKRGQYVILPGLEVRFFYHLAHLLAGGIYPIADMVLGQARRKKARMEGG